jgi:simple sugar transport system ATP-binding protein
MKGIVKQYPGILANDHVDLRVQKGEVHALVGENGAGKTTLMKILYGIEQADAGAIRIDGTEVRIPNVSSAIQLGIGMVHQHFMLVNSLTVAENVVLGAEPKNGLQFFDTQGAEHLVANLAERHGMSIEPSQVISDCPVGVRQSVEILKALYREARILILDEPTAVLTPQEATGLFEAMRTLARSGVTIIFITHKLDEVMAVADGITVLRDGWVTGTLKRDETTPREIARLMVGRDIQALQRDEDKATGQSVLEVDDLVVRDSAGKAVVNRVSLEVKVGEIVGVAGVTGNGQSELLEAIAGLTPVHSGRVVVAGQDITNRGVRATRDVGLGHVPEDRFQRGLAIRATVSENIIMGHHRAAPLSSGLVLYPDAADAFSCEAIERFDIRCRDTKQVAESLSGGNLQKLIVARELHSDPKVLIVGQPTRGLDVGASEFVRLRLHDMAAAGTGILMVSADLAEIRALSDRILVMYRGQIVGELPPETSEEEIGLLMAGIMSTDEEGGTA